MKYIVCHRDVAAKIWCDINKEDSKIHDLTGIKVVINNNMPVYSSKRIVKKNNPFIQYEPSDWDWLTYFGFTTIVEDKNNLNMVVMDFDESPKGTVWNIK